MISKWGVKNFKSILEANLDLAPLTIFTGVNSSGKSSFLQSFALLKQAFDKPDNQEDNNQFILNGHLVDFREFERIYCVRASNYNYKQDTNEIDIQFTILTEDNKEINVVQKLGKGDKGKLKLNSFIIISKIDNNNDEISLKYVRESMTNSELSKISDIDNISFIEISKNNPPPPTFENLPSSLMVYFHNTFIPKEISFLLKSTNMTINIIIKLFSEIPSEELLDEQTAKSYAYNIISEIIKKLTFKELPDEEIEKIGAKIIFEKNPAKFIKELLNEQITQDTYLYNKFKNVLDVLDKISSEEVNEILGFYFNLFDTYLRRLYKEIPKVAENINYYDPFTQIFKEYFPKNRDFSLSNWYLTLSKIDKEKKESIKDKIIKEGSNFIQQFEKYMKVDLYKPDLRNCLRLKDACNELYIYFNEKIKYLGPFRTDPKWEENYSFSEDIDVKGSNTLSCYYQYLDNNFQVENYFSLLDIDSFDFSSPKKTILLYEALNECLNYIGLATGHIISQQDDKIEKDKLLNIFNIKRKVKGDFVIELSFNEKNYRIPQLGTSVSQILPILIMCLTAPLDSTIIIHEPEQALHPKMQSRLADFFIAMALSGRQLLIETHSKYIIEQLRFRIVMFSDKIPLHKNTKLYFVSNEDGISHFKDIGINEFAALDEWPEDFFDESHIISRRIMREVVKKVEAKKQND